jgi:hypothetical protein
MNKFDEMRQAVNDAKRTLSAADVVATDLAYMLEGRLRKVNSVRSLSILKKELRHFNIHTGNWNNDQ